MGPTEINGVPAHPLLIHFVVVLVPLATLALLACSLWPSVMRRFGLSLPVLALVALATVPLTTHAGEWLAERVNESAQLERHTEMGDGHPVRHQPHRGLANEHRVPVPPSSTPTTPPPVPTPSHAR